MSPARRANDRARTGIDPGAGNAERLEHAAYCLSVSDDEVLVRDRVRLHGLFSHSRGRPATPASSSACVNKLLPTRWVNQMT
jgi:hypothetical protein